MQAFYLISTELRNSFKPRYCEVKARLSNGSRDDIALVDVKPPLSRKIYNTPADITRLIVISREEQSSPFSLRDSAVYVYICLPLKEIDAASPLSDEDYTVLDWGSVYRSKEDASEFTKVLTSYRQGMSGSEDVKHKRVMAALAAGVLFIALLIGVILFYTFNLVEGQFASLQKNIYIARQDVRNMVEQAIDSSQEGETVALVNQLRALNSQLEELGREIEEVKLQLEVSEPAPDQEETPAAEQQSGVETQEAVPLDSAARGGLAAEEEAPVVDLPAPTDHAAVPAVSETPPPPETQPPDDEEIIVQAQETVVAGNEPQATDNATLADAIAAVTRQVVTNQ